LGYDKEAVNDLINGRVSCNEKLADHPSVQCRTEGNNYSVGILGILNGLFGANEKGIGGIVAMFDNSKLSKIERYDPNKHNM
jgi:hypothetical protein